MRCTREEVYGTFRRLCEVAGKTCVDQLKRSDRPYIGAWKLEYSKRSYVIMEEGIDFNYSYPLGGNSRSARSMVEVMTFAIQLLDRVKVDELAKQLLNGARKENQGGK